MERSQSVCSEVGRGESPSPCPSLITSETSQDDNSAQFTFSRLPSPILRQGSLITDTQLPVPADFLDSEEESNAVMNPLVCIF